MATGYEDIEQLTSKQNAMLDNALQQQQDITNRQTALSIAELNKNKEDIDKDVNKTNKALYTEYRKASNPYGVNAENLASQGLANSGYAETTQTNLYNTFQRNVTDTLNNARDLKANFDFEINKARETGNITLAQNALNLYNQKLQLLTQEYELKNNREQFLYQKDRDAVADSQWQQQFAYQKERDAIADSQWQQQFNLSKKTSASRSGSGSKSSGNSINLNDTISSNNTADAKNFFLEKSMDTASQMQSAEGKQSFLQKMGEQLNNAVNQGVLTRADANDVVRQVTAKYY